MEAAGLAVGVVSLGLDLATRLQTYIEAVKDFGERLSDLSADISATASIVRQIADLLNEHQQHLDHVPSSASSQPPILTAKGVSDIEAQLRRCDAAYRVIIDILIRAASGSVNPPGFMTAVGLSDLTATRLAKLAARAKWPWLEPRIKACQKRLKSIKVDLLLSLQIASLARHRLSPGGTSLEDQEEDLALKAAAKKLVRKRAEAQGALSQDSSALNARSQSSVAPALQSAKSMMQQQTQSAYKIAEDAARLMQRQEDEKRLSTIAEKAEGISIGSLDDAEGLEAWFLVRNTKNGLLLKLPVRGPTIHKIIKSWGAGEGEESTLGRFLDLSSEHRGAVWDVMDCALKKDARVRALVGLYTRTSHPHLPRHAEVMVLVSTDTEEEVVHLVDLAGRAWRLPYYALKAAIAHSPAQFELARRCDHPTFTKFQLSVDENGREGISLTSLYEHLRPNFKMCMQKASEVSDDTRPATETRERRRLGVIERVDKPRQHYAPPAKMLIPGAGTSPANTPSTGIDLKVAAVFEELFGDEEGEGQQARGDSVEDLLAEWTRVA